MLTQKEQQKEDEFKQYQQVDICFAVGFTLLLHVICVVLFVYYEPEANLHKSLFSQKPLQVRLVSSAYLLKKKARVLKKIRPEVIPEKQLVTVAKPVKNERPEEANYISEYDQKVQEQTKSSTVSPDLAEHEAKLSKDVKHTGSQILLPEQRAGIPRGNLESRPVAEKVIKLNHDKNGILKQKISSGRNSALAGQSLDASTGGNDPINLMPSVQELERYNGAAFNDHLDDIEEDAQTRLNTFQWKHATYFNRIKQSVSQVWSPDRQIKRYDPQGTLFGQRDRYTVVNVTLDREGVVTEVNIKTESGLDYLDEEAVRTFKKAGPFPHPPVAMFGKNSTFRFAFGFHVSYEKGFFSDYRW
jgi:TonB family protein